jgi:hypothetical protein
MSPTVEQSPGVLSVVRKKKSDFYTNYNRYPIPPAARNPTIGSLSGHDSILKGDGGQIICTLPEVR